MTEREFASALLERLGRIPAEDHDWYEALVAAALDEMQGDRAKAIQMADAEYVRKE